MGIFQKNIFIPCLMPVHGYTHNNFSKHFWIFTKPLVSCFRNAPWFWVLFKFNLGKFDIRKKKSQIFCKVAKLISKVFQGKILPKLKIRGCFGNAITRTSWIFKNIYQNIRCLSMNGYQTWFKNNFLEKLPSLVGCFSQVQQVQRTWRSF